jgi:hypothetical protein
MPPPIVTDEMFAGKTRPALYGPVTIEMEEIVRAIGPTIQRTRSVTGIVFPGSTEDRGGKVPEPASGWRVAFSRKQQRRRLRKFHGAIKDHPYNNGAVDVAKGHVMALELGGPDIPENIVPQWAMWQGSGEWREMEREVKRMALEALQETPKRYLMFHCIVSYLRQQDARIAGLRRLCFPARFSVSVTRMIDKDNPEPGTLAESVFDDAQNRNETDDMLGMRAMILAEGDMEWEDWQTGEKLTQKGKKRDAGHFVATGQNSRYSASSSITYSSPSNNYSKKQGQRIEANKRFRDLSPLRDDPNDEEFVPPNDGSDSDSDSVSSSSSSSSSSDDL